MPLLDLREPESPVLTVHNPGFYSPKKDPGGWSFALVAYVRTPGRRMGVVEVLASFGCGYDYAMEGDRGAQLRVFADACGRTPSGIYVLECRWVGSGEDTDYEVHEVRTLTTEEEDTIADNGEIGAIVCEWEQRWLEVPCQCCGGKMTDHGHMNEGWSRPCPK